MYYDTICQFSCNNGYVGSGSQVEDVNTMEFEVDKISPAKVAHEVTVRQKIFRFVSNLGFNLMLTNLRKCCFQACATVAYKCAPDV